MYVYAGDKVIGEISSAGAQVAYTWGADGLVSQRILSGTARSLWHHYGPQGETRQLTNASGAVVNTYKYNAYGLLLSSTGTEPNPHRYGGKYGYYTDTALNAILAGHRWYQPNVMRWTTRDPILFDGGENLYEYVKGNPVRFVDPLGMEPKVAVPEAPPGVNIEDNIAEAQRHRNSGSRISDALWFYDRVRNKGPWDYKQLGSKYEDFGNFNYGACGKAVGIKREALKRAAGAAQRAAGTSKPEWGTPWGNPPYGDEPKDQEMIQGGIEYYYEQQKQ